MPENRLNKYRCQECLSEIVTVDLVDGVTPFAIDCRATPGCAGLMYSSFYQCDQGLRPEWEWYKPANLKGLNDWEREHVQKGGLILQRIPANTHGIDDDPTLRRIVEFIEGLETVSAVILQRQFRITYMTAAKMLDQLVKRRFVELIKDYQGRHQVIKRTSEKTVSGELYVEE